MGSFLKGCGREQFVSTVAKFVMEKEFILGEIKRVAEVLGRTPGRGEMLRHAGIKESDWLGKFWAKWQNAVVEAGLIPNQMQTAYPEEVLLESMVGLIREQGGRFPTVAEMRLKRRNDQTFPNSKVFFSRFGPRDEVAAKVREYCEQREGYDDVALACASVYRPERSANTRAASEEAPFGFVYLIKSGRYHKIGRSNATGRREYEIALQLPDKAKTVHIIQTDDPAGIERYWHQRFADRRKNGEWFELDSSDIKAFMRRKFM